MLLEVQMETSRSAAAHVRADQEIAGPTLTSEFKVYFNGPSLQSADDLERSELKNLT